MIVVNKSGSISYLPGEKKHICFQPGINEIDESEMETVIKKQGDKWGSHYSKYLIVQKPEDETSPEKEMTVRELQAVIENMDEKELTVLKESEENRVGGQRSTIIKLIEKELKAKSSE